MNYKERNAALIADAKAGARGVDLARKYKIRQDHVYRITSDAGFYWNKTPAPKPLSDRNLQIARMWQDGKTLQDISDAFGFTRERARQVVDKTLAYLGETKADHIQIWHKSGPRIFVPDEIVQLVMDGKLKFASALKRAKCGYWVLRRQLKELGWDPRARVREKYARVYEKFMAGATLIELAREQNTTVGTISQQVTRHRKRTGAPPKQGWKRGKQCAHAATTS